MSRSPYYPRTRARVQPRVPLQAPKNNGARGPSGVGACAICHADIPICLSGGLLYVQVPSGFVCQAVETEVCTLFDGLEVGVDEGGNTTLSSDSFRAEVYPS
jgi:hypothetical protein